ncbi:MAG: lytic transglycosylase [Oleispira sp.]|nr:lytic transglycosylase [Oleispira sp.]
MKLLQLFLSLSFLTACAHQPSPVSIQSTPKPLVASPVVSVLDSWQVSQPKSNEDAHDDILQRIIASYGLNHELSNRRIQSQLNWYKKHQGYMDRIASRGERYMYYIAEQIDVRGIPGELALLPIVESAFDPFAYSHGRASGVWQFIPSTGRDFGLTQDWWYDGRRDIQASTQAALSYLEALQREFKGDWLLALASYNTGAGNVRKAIRKNKRKGLPTDFWSLDLPRETRDYVPKLIALAQLIKNPEKHGITIPTMRNEPYFASVNTGGQIDLSQLADISETDLEEIYKLNPGFNRWATHPNSKHQVLIPIDKVDAFTKNLAALPENQRMKWHRYKVKSGDSLITIAKKYHTTPEALRDANNLRRNLIRTGDQLLIPSAYKSQKSYSHSATTRLAKTQSSRRGKTSGKLEYRVRSGDSFWEIARDHKVGIKELAKWNGMAPGDMLKQGQKLVIWKQKKSSREQREVIRKLTYTVRNGDSMARIAGKFKVRVQDIQRWNRQMAKNKYLQPGERLTLYVDVTN